MKKQILKSTTRKTLQLSFPIIISSIFSAITLNAHAITPVSVPPSATSTPFASKQVDGFYHLALGKFQVTALYDGYLDLPANILKVTNPLHWKTCLTTIM